MNETRQKTTVSIDVETRELLNELKILLRKKNRGNQFFKATQGDIIHSLVEEKIGELKKELSE